MCGSTRRLQKTQCVHKIVSDLHHFCCNRSVAFDQLLKACVRRKQNNKQKKTNKKPLNEIKDRPRGNFNTELYGKLHFFNKLTINHTSKSIKRVLPWMLWNHMYAV